MREVITLAVFISFAMFYMQQPVKLDYLWAGLCLIGGFFSCSGRDERLAGWPDSIASVQIT
jgi:hypothetical protein